MNIDAVVIADWLLTQICIKHRPRDLYGHSYRKDGDMHFELSHKGKSIQLTLRSPGFLKNVRLPPSMLIKDLAVEVQKLADHAEASLTLHAVGSLQ